MRAVARAALAAALCLVAACQIIAGLERAERVVPDASPDIDAAVDGSIDAGCRVTFATSFDDAAAATPPTYGFDDQVAVTAATVGLDTANAYSPPNAFRIDAEGSSNVNVGFMKRMGTTLLGARVSMRIRFAEGAPDGGAAGPRYYVLAVFTDVDPATIGDASALAVGLYGDRLFAGPVYRIDDPRVRNAYDAGVKLGSGLPPTAGWVRLGLRFVERCRGEGAQGLAVELFKATDVAPVACLPLTGVLGPSSRDGLMVLGLRTTDDGDPASVYYDDLEISDCRDAGAR